MQAKLLNDGAEKTWQVGRHDEGRASEGSTRMAAARICGKSRIGSGPRWQRQAWQALRPQPGDGESDDGTQ